MDQPDVEDLRSRLAAIVDSSNDVIISKNLDGVISTWNLAAQRLFGYSEAEAIGSPSRSSSPLICTMRRRILRRVRVGERIEHYETRRVTRDGRTLDVSITISPVRDATGTIVGASKILRDVTESRRAREALLESERRLASEAAAARTLQSISTRLMSETTQDSLSAQILDAAMELMASDASSLQMLAPDGESLSLLDWRNLHPDSAAFWQRVTADAGSTCWQTLRHNVRVVVTDVDSCEFMAGTPDLEECRRSGIRAVQSTPLRSRVGRPLGMISTHWHAPHTLTEDDFRLFDVLARQAADLIERTRAEEALRDSEERFRLIANTAPVIVWMSNANKECTYLNQTYSISPVSRSTRRSGTGGWTESTRKTLSSAGTPMPGPSIGENRSRWIFGSVATTVITGGWSARVPRSTTGTGPLRATSASRSTSQNAGWLRRRLPRSISGCSTPRKRSAAASLESFTTTSDSGCRC